MLARSCFAAELFNEYADFRRAMAPGEATIDASGARPIQHNAVANGNIDFGAFSVSAAQERAIAEEAEISGDLADQTFEQPAPV